MAHGMLALSRKIQEGTRAVERTGGPVVGLRRLEGAVESPKDALRSTCADRRDECRSPALHPHAAVSGRVGGCGERTRGAIERDHAARSALASSIAPRRSNSLAKCRQWFAVCG